MGFWRFHQMLEAQHAAHTKNEFNKICFLSDSTHVQQSTHMHSLLLTEEIPDGVLALSPNAGGTACGAHDG